MPGLSLISVISLYALLALVGVFTLLLLWWQAKVLRGESMANPDGSFDDWHMQRTHYGMAFADLFFACPVSIATIVLVSISSHWGFYLLSFVGFFYVYANIITTATSLRFEKPKISLIWFIVYPLGIFIGLAIIAWTIVHFDTIYVL